MTVAIGRRPGTSPSSQFGEAIESFGAPIAVVAGALWAAMLALAWSYEEPSKATSVLVLLLAYAAGVASIRVAFKLGLIERPTLWTVAFIAKLTLSVAILSALWMRPLAGEDLVRTSTQIPGLLTDTTFYDYLAERVASSGFGNSRTLLFATWQSFGIVAYGSLIYKLFGVSTLYVATFNSVFALLAAMSLVGMLRAVAPDRTRVWNLGWLVLYVPVEAYYDSMLSKEPLTNACFYIALLAAARLYASVGRPRWNAVAFAAAIVVLTLIRPNASALALVTPLALLVRGRHVMRRVMMAGVTVALAVAAASFVTNPIAAVSDVVNLASLGERTQLLIQQKAEEGDAGIKQGVGVLLSPRGGLIDVPLTAVRAVVWNYLPYPLLVPKTDALVTGEELLWRDWNKYFKTWIEVARVSSALLLILATPWVLAAFARPARSVSGFRFVAWNFAVPLLVMSNLMFVMGSRYRTLIEPLFFALAAWGFAYGRRAPRALVYGFFLFGILLYETAAAWR